MKKLLLLLLLAFPPSLFAAGAGQQSPPAPQPPVGAAGQAPRGGPVSARDLAAAANDPTSPTPMIQFRDVLAPTIPGADGAGNAFEMQPVLPFGRSRWLPINHMLKITIPLVSIPAPLSTSGLGDIEVFDLVSIKQSWGRWGVGPALVFPTAGQSLRGQGKWQAGPAVAVIYTGTRHLILGAVLENPISFAGDPDRAAVNNLILIPTLTYNLPGGWFAGLSDFDVTFNWKDGGAATIPIGPQVGRVFKIGRQPVVLSMEAAYAAARPSDQPVPRWVLGFEMAFIFHHL